MEQVFNLLALIPAPLSFAQKIATGTFRRVAVPTDQSRLWWAQPDDP